MIEGVAVIKVLPQFLQGTTLSDIEVGLYFRSGATSAYGLGIFVTNLQWLDKIRVLLSNHDSKG